MKLLAKKLEDRERRIPANGLKRIYRETKFEVEIYNQVDFLWINNEHIINMIPIDYDENIYEIDVNDEYLNLILNSQKIQE